MFLWTFGLSPPDASACCSDAAFAAYSAASCRSEVMLWTKRYPEDPAPRGLAGQELGTLERQKGKKKITLFSNKTHGSYFLRYRKALKLLRSIHALNLFLPSWLIQSTERWEINTNNQKQSENNVEFLQILTPLPPSHDHKKTVSKHWTASLYMVLRQIYTEIGMNN